MSNGVQPAPGYEGRGHDRHERERDGKLIYLKSEPRIATSVEAARAEGATDVVILTRHLIPNELAPILVQATLEVGNIILISAGLSFIGFGAQPPTPEWGLMVSEGRRFLMDQWWIATFPAIAILLLVLGFNLVGDGVRDLLDPRLRTLR